MASVKPRSPGAIGVDSRGLVGHVAVHVVGHALIGGGLLLLLLHRNAADGLQGLEATVGGADEEQVASGGAGATAGKLVEDVAFGGSDGDEVGDVSFEGLADGLVDEAVMDEGFLTDRGVVSDLAGALLGLSDLTGMASDQQRHAGQGEQGAKTKFKHFTPFLSHWAPSELGDR